MSGACTGRCMTHCKGACSMDTRLTARSTGYSPNRQQHHECTPRRRYRHALGRLRLHAFGRDDRDGGSRAGRPACIVDREGQRFDRCRWRAPHDAVQGPAAPPGDCLHGDAHRRDRLEAAEIAGIHRHAGHRQDGGCGRARERTGPHGLVSGRHGCKRGARDHRLALRGECEAASRGRQRDRCHACLRPRPCVRWTPTAPRSPSCTPVATTCTPPP